MPALVPVWDHRLLQTDLVQALHRVGRELKVDRPQVVLQLCLVAGADHQRRLGVGRSVSQYVAHLACTQSFVERGERVKSVQLPQIAMVRAEPAQTGITGLDQMASGDATSSGPAPVAKNRW